MKHLPFFLLTALAALVLEASPVFSAQPASAATLETIADSIRVPEARYARADFTESSALLEATVRQALAHADHPDAGIIRRSLTLKATASPEGKREFSATDCTLREMLRRFAATWNVSAIIHGNQILLSPENRITTRP